MYRERRLQRNSAVLFVWRFDNMTATLLRWNLCSVFRARGFRKDKILDVNHTDACSWKYAICLDGLLNGTTWLILRFFLRCFCLWFGPGVFFPAEYFRHLALLLMGCYGITIETFKALVATQLRHIVVRNTGIKKRFDASFSHRVVGEFPARRQWQVFRGAWKELADFVFSHQSFWKPNPIFWFSLVMNSQEKRTFRWFGLFWSPVNKLFIASYWTFSVACFVRFRTERSSMLIFISVAGLTLPFGWPFQVLFATRFIFSQNDIAKFHLPCFVSGSVAEVESEQEPHRTWKDIRIMDAELILIKDALNIFVCQGYCGIWFVPFALLPEFSTLGFKDFSWDWILRLWGCLSLHCYHPSSAGYCARKRTLYQVRILCCPSSSL